MAWTFTLPLLPTVPLGPRPLGAFPPLPGAESQWIACRTLHKCKHFLEWKAGKEEGPMVWALEPHRPGPQPLPHSFLVLAP